MGIIIALNKTLFLPLESLMIDLGGFDWVGDFRLYQKVCLVIQVQLDVGSTADDWRIRQGLYESKEGRYLELSQDRFKERSDEE